MTHYIVLGVTCGSGHLITSVIKRGVRRVFKWLIVCEIFVGHRSFINIVLFQGTIAGSS